MSAVVLIINDLLIRNRSCWFGFFLLFVLALSVRLLPSFISDTGLIYLADLISRSLWIVLYVILIVLFVNDLVLDTHRLKYELMFYKALGLGIFTQFFTKLIILLSYALILTAMFWILLWSLEIKYVLLILILCTFIFMMRLIALYINNLWIYYSSLLLAAISVFYPIYIYPNTAYVLKAPIAEAILYISLYFTLYILLSLKFYLSSWRRECIGLN